MCGIGGVLFHHDDGDGPRAARPPPAFTAVLTARLRHRGPDGAGVFVDDGTALVHTRLALVDVDGGAQPLATPDGRFVLVANGEVYGHARHRARLEARGAHFRTRSDIEVLLWTLALDGADGLAHLETELAFCLWDRQRRTALLGRDRLGVKPLVVAVDRGALWFASEAQALLAVLPHRRMLDDDVVVEALVAPSLSAATVPFVGLRELPAGAVVSVDAAGMRTVRDDPFRHRRSSSPSASLSSSASSTASALAAALHEAVVDRLVADSPVGAFLSGGVDSSALVAAAVRGGSTGLPCFTLRFDDGAVPATLPPGDASGSIVVGDDAPFSELLAARWPLRLERVSTGGDAFDDDVDALCASQDRLVAWEQELSQRALSRVAAQQVKAVVVGDAADETHFGYAFALSPDACRSPRALLERFGFSRRRALLRPSLRGRADDVLERHRALAASADTPFLDVDHAGTDDGANGGASDRANDARALRSNRQAMTTLLVRRWLPRLLHNGDLHTLAFGLEARVPFADARVLGVAAGVDVDDGFCAGHGLGGGPEKAVLRQAVAPWLPPEIVARRKSALPRDERLAPRWRARLRTLLATSAARERLATFFDVDAVGDFAARDDDDDTTRSLLFGVVCAEGFLRHHVAGPAERES